MTVVMGPSRPVASSLAEFRQIFPNEETCAAYLRKRRWPDGFVCPVCNGCRGTLLGKRAHTYQCLDCRHQTTITSGTVMHKSKLPLRQWFSAAHLVATHPEGVSARQLQALLRSGYKTAWLLKKKLQLSNVPKDNEPLQGLVEVNQREMSFIAKSRVFGLVLPLKFVIAGALEMTGYRTEKAELPASPRPCRIRLAAVSGNSLEFMPAFIRTNVQPGTTLLTDGRFRELCDYRYAPRKEGAMPPRMEETFSAIKDWLSTQDKLDEDFVNAGLRRFAAHLNWRVSFDAVLGIFVRQEPKTYWDIIGHRNPRKGTVQRNPRSP